MHNYFVAISDQLNDTEFLLITLNNKESIRIFDLKIVMAFSLMVNIFKCVPLMVTDFSKCYLLHL